MALASKGATVILAARNATLCAETAAEIKQRAGPSAKVEVGPPLDLSDNKSVRAFAKTILESKRPVNVLINNAGTNAMKEWTTPEGCGGLAQTNYLGPFLLTRLLEPRLIESKARVVNVSSVTHRFCFIKDPVGFLKKWSSGGYAHTKLANVLFTYEAQRRMGKYGVENCAVDPGAIRTGIWRNTPFEDGFVKTLINNCYAPPEDGCSAVVHAATMAWDKPTFFGGPRGQPAKDPSEDFRFFARGLFASPTITWYSGARGFLGHVEKGVFGIGTIVQSMIDYPLRALTGSMLNAGTFVVPSSKQSYDRKLAEDLWNASCSVLGLPTQVQLPAGWKA